MVELSRLNTEAIVAELTASAMMKPVSNKTAWDAAKLIKALIAEKSGLEDLLLAVTLMTATGEGLTPEETIRLHLLCDIRENDPAVTVESMGLRLIKADAEATAMIATLTEERDAARRRRTVYQEKCEGMSEQAEADSITIDALRADVAQLTAKLAVEASDAAGARAGAAENFDKLTVALERVTVLTDALRAAKTNARKAFNQTENFYAILSAVDAAVDAAFTPATKGSAI